MLQHTFIRLGLLVGNVFGLKVFKNGTYRIFANPLYRTYEYIDLRTTVSLIVYLALNPSRSGTSTTPSPSSARCRHTRTQASATRLPRILNRP